MPCAVASLPLPVMSSDDYEPITRYTILEGLEFALALIADGKLEHATRILTALHCRLNVDAAMAERDDMVEWYGSDMLNQ